MDNFILLVIGVLFILLAGLLIFYFQTQQSFKEITDKLEAMEHPQNGARSTETLKRDLALHRDVLFVLEADISKNKRESLAEEELKKFGFDFMAGYMYKINEKGTKMFRYGNIGLQLLSANEVKLTDLKKINL